MRIHIPKGLGWPSANDLGLIIAGREYGIARGALPHRQSLQQEDVGPRALLLEHLCHCLQYTEPCRCQSLLILSYPENQSTNPYSACTFVNVCAGLKLNTDSASASGSGEANPVPADSDHFRLRHVFHSPRVCMQSIARRCTFHITAHNSASS